MIIEFGICPIGQIPNSMIMHSYFPKVVYFCFPKTVHLYFPISVQCYFLVTTLKKFGISEFQQKAPNFYNLDVIISVGYRVKSIQGTKFRQWATKRIHEYIVKGFTMDDDRLKQEGARSRYFEELLQRIRRKSRSTTPSRATIFK